MDSRGVEVTFKESGIFEDIVYFVKCEESKLPTFPIEALPPIISEYTTAVAESLQVSIDMVAVAILGIISSCLQGTFFIEPKADWKEPLNLYILVVAKPSERKTPVLKEVTRPVYDYVAIENEKRKPSYDEYLIKKNILSKRVTSLTEKASKPSKGKQETTIQDVIEAQKELSELEEVSLMRLLVDDITTEALVKVMKENNEHISIVTAEGGIFGMLAGRYSNQPNMDIFLKAYSGEKYTSDRIGRKGEELDTPLLTLLVMVQPVVVNEAMQNKEFRERGLLARFLYSIPSSKVGSRVYDSKPIRQEVRQAYDDLVKELLSIGKHEWQLEENVIHLSKDAYALSEEFFNEIERQLIDEYEEIEDWAGKYHGQTMRIAGILHCIKHRLAAPTTELEEETMKEAIKIGRYFLEHAMASFKIAGLAIPQEEKDAKYILGKLEEYHASQNTQNITKRELHQVCRGRFCKIEDMQVGLEELTRRNYIRIEKKKTGQRGRPTEVIEVNPAYWEQQPSECKTWVAGEF